MIIKKVLAIASGDKPSAYVGIVAPMRELSYRNIIKFKFKDISKVRDRHITEADILICIRSSTIKELEIAKTCKKEGKYIIYFLDDDLLHVPMNIAAHKHYANPNTQTRMYTIMSLSDCLWTPSVFIEEKYGAFFNKTVITRGVALLLADSGTINQIQLEQKEDIVIGFSGGPDHRCFLEGFLEPIIQTLLNKYGDKIRFEFMGAKPAFINKFALSYIPYQKSLKDYANVLKSRKWDIGLAPLPSSSFHRCKYYNKYLEYGAIGAAGVYSNVQPFQQIIIPGINGMLAENEEDQWINKISDLIDNPAQRSMIKINARKQLEQDYSVSYVAQLILSNEKNLTSP